MENSSRRVIRSRAVFWLATAAVAGLLSTFTVPAAAQEPASDLEMMVKGRVTYRIYCTSCHGATARGDGNLAQYMTVQPANLTQLAAQTEDGVFPAEQLHTIIDGREPGIRGHGAKEMPVWGDVFGTLEDGTTDPERVNRKISELVVFLESIQESVSSSE